MDYDGSNVRTVTANQGINKFPDWSGDNSKLAFVTILPRQRPLAVLDPEPARRPECHPNTHFIRVVTGFLSRWPTDRLLRPRPRAFQRGHLREERRRIRRHQHFPSSRHRHFADLEPLVPADRLHFGPDRTAPALAHGCRRVRRPAIGVGRRSLRQSQLGSGRETHHLLLAGPKTLETRCLHSGSGQREDLPTDFGNRKQRTSRLVAGRQAHRFPEYANRVQTAFHHECRRQE